VCTLLGNPKSAIFNGAISRLGQEQEIFGQIAVRHVILVTVSNRLEGQSCTYHGLRCNRPYDDTVKEFSAAHAFHDQIIGRGFREKVVDE
jgi:hypothetical protein